MHWTAKLSVLDQRKPIMYQSFFLCFPSQAPDRAAEALVRGIKSTTALFPYLAGEIFQGEDQGFTCISWHDGDSLEVERKASASLPSYEELRTQGMPLHRLSVDLRPTGACANSLRHLERAPAFLSSYTIIEGGLILGFAFHHHLVDGVGIGDILAVIADNTTGRVTALKHNPQAILHRYEDVNKALGMKVSTAEATATDGLLPANCADLPGKVDMRLDLAPRIVTFSVEALDALRDSFASQLQVGRPSLVVLISCVLWLAISDVRSKHQSLAMTVNPPTTTMLLAMNFRTSFGKESYFNSDDFVGNFADAAVITEPTTDLSMPPNDSKPTEAAILNRLARPMRDIVQSLTAASSVAKIQALYRRTLNIHDARSLRESMSWPPNTVTLTSYASFPWYLDFGSEVGKVEFFRFATAVGEGVDGGIALLPRKREQKGGQEVIEVCLKLKDEDMEKVEQHALLTPLFAKQPF